MARGLPRTLSRAAARQLGKVVPKAGLFCKVSGQGGAYRLEFTFVKVKVAVTDALAYANQKLFDFVEGKIRVKGGTATFTFGVDTARASTINDSASLTWGIGSAAASSAILATAMQNVVNTVTRTLTVRWRLLPPLGGRCGSHGVHAGRHVLGGRPLHELRVRHRSGH